MCVAILGSDCAPLPVPPILVGHEQDLLSVSPLCMSVWVRKRCVEDACFMNASCACMKWCVHVPVSDCFFKGSSSLNLIVSI